jgi:hypothetical protein
MQCLNKTLPGRRTRPDLRTARPGCYQNAGFSVVCQAQQQRQADTVQDSSRPHVATKAASLTHTGLARADSSDLECIASGLDSVVCELPQGSVGSASQPVLPDGASTQPQQSSVLRTLELLAPWGLLLPFFFWGTSMVAMKVRSDADAVELGNAGSGIGAVQCFVTAWPCTSCAIHGEQHCIKCLCLSVLRFLAAYLSTKACTCSKRACISITACRGFHTHPCCLARCA